MNAKRTNWTHEEDTNLIELIKLHGLKWTKIAKYMKDRNRQQCADRWNNALDPKILKGSWSPEEDTNLIELIKIHGLKWAKIAKYMKDRNGQQCACRWNNALDPKISKGNWTLEEDEKLKKLIKKYGSKWSIIAQIMGNRSSLQCRDRWNLRLNRKNNESKRDWTSEEDKKLLELEDKMLINLVEKFGTRWGKVAECMKNRNYFQCYHRWNNTLNPPNKPWTVDEDQKLKKLVKVYGSNWNIISVNIDGRTHLQCCKRWSEYLDPKIIRQKWSRKEDTNLIELIKIHGLKWVEIAKHMKGRNDTQCSQRWHFTLDPKIIKGSWTPEEDENLRQMVKKYGSKWSIIAQNMGNRTSLQCRRRWNCKLNKTNNNELKRDWTPEEDKKLLELVKEHGYNRKKISENMNKRSYTDSLWRYNFHLNPNIRKGKWTPNEDKMLIELVEKFGTRWGKIAECMKVRSCYQCCTRWNRILRPDNKPWTPKEDQKLKKLVKVYGLNWEKISENMDDRTSFQCRKRWSEYVDPKIIRQKWSRKEDKQLINLEMFSYYDNQSEDETSQQAIDSDYDSDATIIDIPN
ncbi:hypothetical protein RDWZM_008492 [Blomia tropicalis]|uniref:Uncharacterized protein n=1 Tax=Blomia tropicalis TaxID=40697 RepID=A0A9Q0M137_BLOTA|nr:hypothetical protein RDWZM_008492 [Blomia tropicalis]